jgi:hypothetical protein
LSYIASTYWRDSCYAFIRTTLNLPDDLHRKAKALAALEGYSLGDWIVSAIQARAGLYETPKAKGKKLKVVLPGLRIQGGKKLDLRGFDFDRLILG